MEVTGWETRALARDVADLPPESPERPADTLDEQSAQIRYDVPDCPKAIVYGDPQDAARKVDWRQGDTDLNVKGNCGLTSVANLLELSGRHVGEREVTRLAMEKKLCAWESWRSPAEKGGTDIQQRQVLLKAYGISSEIAKSYEDKGSLSSVAQEVMAGKGCLMSVNAGILWKNPAYIGATYGGRPVSNHVVTVTGAAFDARSGGLKGLYICDSGRGEAEDACRFVSVQELNQCYTQVVRAGVNITANPIRA